MDQQPLFFMYTRHYLNQATGFSRGYLSRVATGRLPLSRSFIERVCFKLGESEEKLFLPDFANEESLTIAARPDDEESLTIAACPDDEESLPIAALPDS